MDPRIASYLKYLFSSVSDNTSFALQVKTQTETTATAIYERFPSGQVKDAT